MSTDDYDSYYKGIKSEEATPPDNIWVVLCAIECRNISGFKMLNLDPQQHRMHT